ncbi:DNA polymerase II large subunit [Candidatus Woesearchaeota archaeon]|nr:DNA polymerase II large subunit [Candidatus Woesearchaeota archaeon]
MTKESESKEMQEYFEAIENQLSAAYKVANEARKKGYDPEEKVDIPLAHDMAERVEGLISAVTPKLLGSGMIKRIRELEREHGALAWEVALKIAEEVAQEKFCKFGDRKEAMETGIRVGFAYHTLGIVSAPLEGFVELKIKKRRDGKDYLAVSYAGPVRGAGGTGASVSVVIADYVRKKMGYDVYDPDEKEINRTITELYDYHEFVTNLQYKPSKEEIALLVKNLTVEVDGDPTEKIEVSNYKDLDRISTNKIRSGVCLVVSMLTLKAPKLWKKLQKFQKEFGIDWSFLEKFLELQKKKKAGTEEKEKTLKVTPNYTYIADLVAGRPVLSHPSAAGGFRLRYGRSRTSGFSAAAIHPATMRILNKYVAVGTQLKIERPGKATAVTSCDAIDGPIVKLTNGNVIKINTEEEAKDNLGNIGEILFLGDILINYGDFSENGHALVPAGYCEEWYAQELEKATVDLFGSLDVEKLSDLAEVPSAILAKILKNPSEKISASDAINISRKLNIPLHPSFSYYWTAISTDQFLLFLEWFKKASIIKEEKIIKIVLPFKEDAKRILELVGAPHLSVNEEFVVIEKEEAESILASLNITSNDKISELEEFTKKNKEKNPLEIINSISSINLRDKAGTFIGARMGRPEKSKMRKLTGSPQVLFPVGEEGGRLRSFQSASEIGKVRADLPIYYCGHCNKETVLSVCETCDKKTKKKFFCRICGNIEEQVCKKHGPASTFKTQDVNINELFDAVLNNKLKTKTTPDLIKGVRGTSNKDHIPENILKGIIRAKHDVYVNKDGTIRYDMTELPITHFKQREIKTSLKKLKELGYEKDIFGKELESGNQIIELRPQDIILPSGQEALDETADIVLMRMANFVDELLAVMYGQQPFYNFKNKEDLIGSIVIGLAPHISAGMIGRVIGFSETQGCYAHPLWHAALRRDCDGDECCIMLLMDALLNFSRQFLPDKRGGRTMDSPLVLTTKLIPGEVDDMVHGMDVARKYPLELYDAASKYKYPWEVEIEKLGKRLGTAAQYEGLGFTHDVSSINSGVMCSAYKTLPSMEEKLKGQMDLAERIRAVNAVDVARLVIEKHLLRDIRGNLRKFSTQQFRCVKCNEKFRRPPLIGKCTKCGGKIIFTVSEGSVVKYLEPTLSLAEKYNLPPYLKQTLELTKRMIEGVFGKQKDKQTGLGKWFG